MLAHRDPLDANFAALADPTRRAILARLAQGHMHLDDLAQPFGISAFRHFGPDGIAPAARVAAGRPDRT